MVRQLLSLAALLILPLVTVPASAQQERTGQDQERATPSDSSAPQIRPTADDSTGVTEQVQPSGDDQGQPAPEEHIRPTPEDKTNAAPTADDQRETDNSGQAQERAAVGGAAGEPGMTAKLVDAGAKARNREATVEVEVQGVEMVDPATTDGQPKAGQGHMHYRVDGGPVIATPSTKLSFHELRPGRHQLFVQLVGNDHKPLGPQQTFTINVPS